MFRENGPHHATALPFSPRISVRVLSFSLFLPAFLCPPAPDTGFLPACSWLLLLCSWCDGRFWVCVDYFLTKHNPCTWPGDSLLYMKAAADLHGLPARRLVMFVFLHQGLAHIFADFSTRHLSSLCFLSSGGPSRILSLSLPACDLGLFHQPSFS